MQKRLVRLNLNEDLPKIMVDIELNDMSAEAMTNCLNFLFETKLDNLFSTSNCCIIIGMKSNLIVWQIVHVVVDVNNKNYKINTCLKLNTLNWMFLRLYIRVDNYTMHDDPVSILLNAMSMVVMGLDVVDNSMLKSENLH